MLTPEMFDRIYAKVSALTMVPPESLAFSWRKAVGAAAAGHGEPLVECGVWRGGCSLGMALAQRMALGEVRAPVYMFDSFAGLPPATTRDGPAAQRYQEETTAPEYFDNCRASAGEVEAARNAFGLSQADCAIIPGWFEETLPIWRKHLAQTRIALLRIDCDWYRPVRLVLEELVPLVAEDGLVIIDDYYSWDGCARAVHDYLSVNDKCYRIRALPDFSCAYFIKQEARR